MKKRSILPGLLAAGALAIAGCGDDADTAGEGASKAAGNGVDRAFAAKMIPHHESAVKMALIAQERGESGFVRELADDIVRTQKREISTLRREDAQLADAGVKQGSLGVPEHMMGMAEDTETLKTVAPFDQPFIKMMVPHHRGAIEMAKVELGKGSDPELKALAQAIIDAQRREIEAMTAHLAQASAAPRKRAAIRVDHDDRSSAGDTDVSAGRPARTTASKAAAAGTGPRDLPVPTASR